MHDAPEYEDFDLCDIEGAAVDVQLLNVVGLIVIERVAKIGSREAVQRDVHGADFVDVDRLHGGAPLLLVLSRSGQPISLGCEMSHVLNQSNFDEMKGVLAFDRQHAIFENAIDVAVCVPEQASCCWVVRLHSPDNRVKSLVGALYARDAIRAGKRK
jgi:hypothetical protein